MVGIFSTQIVNMQGNQRVIDKPLEKFVKQVHIEVPHYSTTKRYIKYQAGAAGEIYDYARKCLIQGHIGMAIPQYAFFIAHRLGKSLPQCDADIFHRVVGVDVQVALGGNTEIHHPMTRNLVEHVL